MAALVLDLCKQDGLALECRRTRQPVTFGLHADDLGVRVLRDLPNKRATVGLGHPVLGLDLLLGVDALLKRRELLGSIEIFALGPTFVLLVKTLRIHESPSRIVGASRA